MKSRVSRASRRCLSTLALLTRIFYCSVDLLRASLEVLFRYPFADIAFLELFAYNKKVRNRKGRYMELDGSRSSLYVVRYYDTRLHK